MALNGNQIWEVRSGGNDNNGGGFRAGGSGTDRTLQNAAHVTIDGTTISATTHTTTTLITLVGYTVSAADVHNVLQITGGTATAGFYEITAVDVGNNRWTLDRAPGVAATTVIGAMGGALATPGKACGATVNGNDVYIKAATYVLSSGTANVAGGRLSPTAASAGSNITRLIGYDTNRSATNSDTRPVIQVPGDGSVTSIAVVTVNAFVAIYNITVDGNNQTAITGFTHSTNNRMILYKCRAYRTTVNGFSIGARGQLILCEAEGFSGTAGFSVNGTTTFSCCQAYGGTTTGFTGNIPGTVYLRCLSYNNSGASSDGFADAGEQSNYYHCVAYGNGRNGFFCQGSSAGSLYVNCIAEANGATGFGVTNSIHLAFYSHCAAYGNTTAAYTTANVLAEHAIGFILGTTGTFFTDAANDDFTLNDLAGQGALVRGTGFNISTTGLVGYPDVGAFQHQDAGGGAAGHVQSRAFLGM